MKRIAWIRLAALALVAFFVLGAIGNLAALGTVAEDYARWGYPPGFRYLTGALELTAAALLARQRTRRWGVLLGLAIMGAAATTLLIQGEVSHVCAPIVVFCLLLALGLGLRRHHRRHRRHRRHREEDHDVRPAATAYDCDALDLMPRSASIRFAQRHDFTQDRAHPGDPVNRGTGG